MCSQELSASSVVSQRKALFKSYYSSRVFEEMLWLPPHSNRHHFRVEIRREDDSRVFVRIRNGISDPSDLRTFADRLVPSGIFFTPAEWLDPIHLRLTRERVRDCMLTSPLYFDIDARGRCARLQTSIGMTSKLIEVVRQMNARDPDMIVFSGKSGFHVYYWNWDDIPLRYEHPQQRIEAFILSRRELLSVLKSRGVTVDTSVTADPWRVLRLPGSLHWDTGLIACQVSQLDQFRPERDAVAFPSESYEGLFVKHTSDNTHNSENLARTCNNAWKSRRVKRDGSPFLGY